MNSHAGLEKTLRLVQSLLQIAAAIPVEIGIDDELAARFSKTKSDIAVCEFEIFFFFFLN